MRLELPRLIMITLMELRMLSGKPVVKATDDLPSGKVDVTITPAFTVGLPL